ncbi:hypothetical protein [Paludifilum halophilum]|uniref:Uncharacterized protein n=1 Tax=Paludifilum halophilum TaxID=1642702 RepID=A0A235B8D9_9BACL|nr:hypothetical protein [Paludifilum halophilum]OYD08546.1 hypothetical protein CHM34_06885 [Paludifilum halophilum]
MARTAIPVDSPTTNGILLQVDTTIDQTNGMEFTNTGREVLLVENTGTGALTVTLDYAPDRFGRDGQKSVTLQEGETKVIGPFDRDLYNQNNKVYVDFDAATGNVAVVKVLL